MQVEQDYRRVLDDLRKIGREAEVVCEPGNGQVLVAFPYTVETGPERGTALVMGVQFQETGYPEYPPHWVLATRKRPTGETPGKEFLDEKGRRWYGYSRNYGEVWDRCKQKDMRAFIQVAIRPFWRT